MSQDKPWKEVTTRVYVVQHPVVLFLEKMEFSEDETFVSFMNIECENNEEAELLDPEGPLGCWDAAATHEKVLDRIVIDGSEGPGCFGVNIRLVVPVDKISNWSELQPLFN